MLCPHCRRQVGRDGFCPEGHEVRPAKADVVPPPPPQPAVPAPQPGVASASTYRRPLVIGIVLALLATVVLRVLVFGPAASAANLKFLFIKGATHTYAFEMTFDFDALSVQYGGMAFEGSMATMLTERTIMVDEEGVATVAYELGEIRFTQGGTTVDLPAPGEILRARMAPDGTVHEAKGKGFLSFAGSDPMAGFANMSGPETFTPILPNHRVEPGDSWSINKEMPNPFGEKINFRGTATLVERRTDRNDEIAAIHSVMEMPINMNASFAEIATSAGRDVPSELEGIRMTFNGFFNGDVTQSIGIKSGSLKSILGDIKMRGTIGFEGIPGAEGFEAVFNGTFSVTMTEVTGPG